MNGLGPLVDTLLATRLAQRVDLVPLKPEVQVAGPGPATPVEDVVNDVRLSSRAAVEQQLGVGPLKSDQRGHGGTAAQPAPAVTLSGAARTLSAILDGQTGTTSRIVGSEPLLTLSQPSLSPSAIAQALARTVGQSGLFYESHLAQFAAGAKSLAELAQEPQARLASANLTSAPVPPGTVNGPGVGTHPSMDLAGDRAAPLVVPPSGDAASSTSEPGKPGTASALPAAADAAAQAHKNAYASMQEADRSMPLAKNYDEGAAAAARSSPPVPAGIHPEALALVRQQLELLAQPVFRWSGEAWPAVPLDWEIHRDERQAAAGDDAAAPKRWSTRLALTLPTLGDIEVRISLTGNGLQVRLAASDNATLDLLQETRGALPASLRESGLELTDLQIGPLASPDAGPAPEAADGT